VGNVIELYWVLALVLIVLIAVELARATLLVTRLRGHTRPSIPTSHSDQRSAPPGASGTRGPGSGTPMDGGAR
jgi:Ca-activated chloride channel family protein